MPTALIVGASRGIGLELARQYAADGWSVHATCRDRSDALKDLSGDVQVHQLDVCDPAQIAALAASLADLPVDLHVHNAGVLEPQEMAIGNLDAVRWLEVLRINTVAPLMVAEALVDRVLASQRKVMTFVSSRMGSIGENSGGDAPIYRSSKAGLNAAVRCLANAYGGQGLTAVVVHPGWVRTDMGGPTATLSVAESGTALRRLMAGLTPAHNGRFWNYDGAELPW